MDKIKEKVLDGLMHCKQETGSRNCVECPYYLSKGMCTTNLLNDAIDVISSFETKVDKAIEVCHGCHEKYTERIKQAKAEAPTIVIYSIGNRSVMDYHEYKFIKQNIGKPLKVFSITWNDDGISHIAINSMPGSCITIFPRNDCNIEFV